MSIWILRAAALLYAGAAAVYVFQFAKPRTPRAAALGQALLAVAFVLHAVSIGFACSEFQGAEFFTLRGGLVMAAWLATGGLLLLLRFYDLPAVATFAYQYGRSQVGLTPEEADNLAGLLTRMEARRPRLSHAAL